MNLDVNTNEDLARSGTGIVISKIPYQEADAIITMICSTGEKSSFYVYKGFSGSKKKQSSIWELGHVISFSTTLNKFGQSTNDSSALHSIKEAKLKWQHFHIRHSHLAFFTLQFMSEVIKNVSLTAKAYEEMNLYHLMTNAIYFLDQNVAPEKEINIHTHLNIFLGKLIYILGIFPIVNSCLFCHQAFVQNQPSIFIKEQGGFSCLNCSSHVDLHKMHAQGGTRKSTAILNLLLSTHASQYRQIDFQNGSSNQDLWRELFDYLCIQVQLNPNLFKSLRFLR